MLIVLYIAVIVVCVITTIPKDQVDGNWTQWLTWSSCDVTCGNGTRTRLRFCINPAPTNGGHDCIGSSTDTELCQTDACAVQGSWIQWSSWGSCSVSCDVGMQRWDRSCSSPYLSSNVNNCIGDSQDDRICMLVACADGGWTDWSSWGTCSKTCSTGTRSRSRTCTHPRPSITGRYCEGLPTEVDTCRKQTCSDTKIAFNARNASLSNPSKFTTVLSNDGDGYNSSTGKFTCPVAGVYFFASTITKRWDVNTDYIECHMYINWVDMVGTWEAPYDQIDDNGGYSLTLVGTFHLNKSDVVQIICPRGSNVFYQNWSSFTGFLVASD